MKPRRATSLIELVVVIGAEMALLGLAVTLIGVLLVSERQSRRQVEQGLLRDGLMDRFRADVQAAQRIELPNASTLHLHYGADQQVSYTALPGQIHRLQQQQGQTVAREMYRLGEGSQARFDQQMQSEPDQTRIGLTLVAPQAAGTSRGDQPAQRFWRWEAWAGRDARFNQMRD